jgi:hypothetical protein
MPLIHVPENQAPTSPSASLGKFRDLETIDTAKLNLQRLRLVRVQWAHSPSRSMRGCCRRVVDTDKPVVYSATSKSVSISNVSYCRSWACPWCAYKRSQDLAETLAAGLSVANQRDFYTRFLTFTIPSDRWSFDYQLKILREAFKNYRARFNRHIKHHYGVKTGFSYSFDITIRKTISKSTGKRFQPHLHIHAIALVEDAIHDVSFDSRRCWQECVDKAHGKPVRLYKDAIHVENIKADDGVSSYVFKWLGSASELMKSQNKSGKLGKSMSFYELVELIHDGKAEDAIQVYQEILIAMKGKHFSSVGRLMKRLSKDFEPPEPEETDELLVEEEEIHVELHWISHTAIVSIGGALEFVLKQLQRKDLAKIQLIKATNAQAEKMFKANLFTNQQIREIWRENLLRMGFKSPVIPP